MHVAHRTFRCVLCRALKCDMWIGAAGTAGLTCAAECLNQIDACICNVNQLPILSAQQQSALDHATLSLVGEPHPVLTKMQQKVDPKTRTAYENSRTPFPVQLRGQA